jgi:replicative DNA helicase
MSLTRPITYTVPAMAEEPVPRTPPNNVEAEQALLAAILVNNSAYERVAEFLQAEHFYNPIHQKIFAAITRLIGRGQMADPVTLKGYFEFDGTLTAIGGAGYIAKLALSAISIINAADYGRSIHDAYLRRQLIEIGTDTVNESFELSIELDGPKLIELAEKRLFDLATAGTVDGGFQPFAKALTSAVTIAEQAYKRSGKTSGLATGFTDLDRKLGGLHASDLIIIAGRPSMGKTALATNIGFNVAKEFRAGKNAAGKVIAENGGVVGFFSLEMSAEQLATRILAEESGVSSDRIRRGDIKRDEFDSFIQASTRLEAMPLHIDDTPALSIQAVRTRARRLQRQHGLDLVIVDYLQLLQSVHRPGAEQNRVQELSEITRGLKALAKDLSVPVIALSQLSRAVEQREDKRPQLADLRESGSIEQDADVVMFVFREEYYLSRSEPTTRPDEAPDKLAQRYDRWFQRSQEVHGTAEILIAKQRHGPIGSVTLTFEAEITKFSDHVSGDRLPTTH